MNDFSAGLVLGFVSSLHCVQMCGPIVVAYSVSIHGEPEQRHGRFGLLPLHLAYNAGRIVTYTVLGALAGITGGGIASLGRFVGVQNGVMLLAGAAMVLAGLAMFGLVPESGFLRRFAFPQRLLRPAGKLVSSRTLGGKFALGLLLGLLPCGLVYMALLKAMSAGTAVAGAVTLFAFGAGTTAALLTVGMFSSVATGWMARWGTRVAAATVIIFGALLIVHGTNPGPLGQHMHGHN